MEKLGQCNEMFAKLQEMTNKHVEKYTGIFLSTVTLNKGRRETKYQTESANKDVKAHAVEETRSN